MRWLDSNDQLQPARKHMSSEPESHEWGRGKSLTKASCTLVSAKLEFYLSASPHHSCNMAAFFLAFCFNWCCTLRNESVISEKLPQTVTAVTISFCTPEHTCFSTGKITNLGLLVASSCCLADRYPEVTEKILERLMPLRGMQFQTWMKGGRRYGSDSRNEEASCLKAMRGRVDVANGPTAPKPSLASPLSACYDCSKKQAFRSDLGEQEVYEWSYGWKSNKKHLMRFHEILTFSYALFVWGSED